MERDEAVQLAERALFDAEAAHRADPSEANRRRVARAWAQVREARGEPPAEPPFPVRGGDGGHGVSESPGRVGPDS